MPKSFIGSLLLALIISGLSLLCIILVSQNFSNTIKEHEQQIIDLKKRVNDLENKTDAIYQQSKKSGPVSSAANNSTSSYATAGTSSSSVSTAATVKYGVINNAHVNLRNSASTSGQTLRILQQGETVSLLGEDTTQGGYAWIKVQDIFGNVGWVVKSFIKAQ